MTANDKNRETRNSNTNNEPKEGRNMKETNNKKLDGLDAISKAFDEAEEMSSKTDNTIAGNKTGSGAANGHVDAAVETTGNKFNEPSGETEETVDFCVELLEQCADDPDFVYNPEVIKKLASLRSNDRARFEKLRRGFKKIKDIEISRLDARINEEGSDIKRKPTQFETLKSFIDGIDLFKSPTEVGHACLEVSDRIQIVEVKSEAFKLCLEKKFYEETENAPGDKAMNAAIKYARVKAQFNAPKQKTFLRVGSLEDRLFLDLADEKGRVVEVSRTGWRVRESSPIPFIRTQDMKPLPVPKAGGSIEALRKFLNIKDEEFPLAVAWLLAALRDEGPYPILSISGAQGSSKTTCSEILCNLIDPKESLSRPLPSNKEDLFISATNAHILMYNNLQKIPPSTSALLCQLLDEGAFTRRKKYTDRDETRIQANVPVIANGINNPVTAADLADRALFFRLGRIPEEQRKQRRKIREEFEAELPYILGALLDGVVAGIRNLERINPPSLPRLADFAAWAMACEEAYWPEGTFLKAYAKNREGVNERVIESSPAANNFFLFIQDKPDWQGTATQLLHEVEKVASERLDKPRDFPSAASTFSEKLREFETPLREVGIDIEWSKKRGERIITIRNNEFSDAIDADARGNAPAPLTPQPTNDNIVVEADESTQDEQPNAEEDKVEAVNASLSSPFASPRNLSTKVCTVDSESGSDYGTFKEEPHKAGIAEEQATPMHNSAGDNAPDPDIDSSEVSPSPTPQQPTNDNEAAKADVEENRGEAADVSLPSSSASLENLSITIDKKAFQAMQKIAGKKGIGYFNGNYICTQNEEKNLVAITKTPEALPRFRIDKFHGFVSLVSRRCKNPVFNFTESDGVWLKLFDNGHETKVVASVPIEDFGMPQKFPLDEAHFSGSIVEFDLCQEVINAIKRLYIKMRKKDSIKVFIVGDGEQAYFLMFPEPPRIQPWTTRVHIKVPQGTSAAFVIQLDIRNLEKIPVADYKLGILQNRTVKFTRIKDKSGVGFICCMSFGLGSDYGTLQGRTPPPIPATDSHASETETATSNKAVIYLRADAMEEDDGSAINAKLKHLLKNAIDENLDVVQKFIDTPPSSDERKALEEMLVFLREHRDVGTVIVNGSDRLFCSFMDHVKFGELIDDLGIQIHYA